MARLLERIVASLGEETKEAIIMRRIGNKLDLEYASEEGREGVVLVHALEALRFCRRAMEASVDVGAEVVAKKLNENPFFFFSTQDSTGRSDYADDNLWQFRCFPCHPVAG